MNYLRLKRLTFLLRGGLLDAVRDTEAQALSKGLGSRSSRSACIFKIDRGIEGPVVLGFAVAANPESMMEFQLTGRHSLNNLRSCAS